MSMIEDMNIGDKYITKSKTITARDVDTFCQANNLNEDLFWSDEAAKAAGLKGRVVPGAQTLVLSMGLLEEVASGLILAGMDKISFLAPLYPEDEVSVEVELLGKKVTSKGDRLFLTYSWVLRNQEGTSVAQGENTECTTKS